jgi:hypothetical protein
MGVSGQRHAPAALPPGMNRYPLYRRLGGPQGRSVRVLKISPTPGFDPRTVQFCIKQLLNNILVSWMCKTDGTSARSDMCVCVVYVCMCGVCVADRMVTLKHKDIKCIKCLVFVVYKIITYMGRTVNRRKASWLVTSCVETAF